jgi:hypothetical protein
MSQTYAVAFLSIKPDGNKYITSITLHECQASNENEAIGNAISSAFNSNNGFSINNVVCLQIGGTSEESSYLFKRAKNLAEENGKMREALLRLRRWNMGGSYSAEVVSGLQDWIDGGMTGDLPPYPDHYPPIKCDPVAALAQISALIGPSGQEALAKSEHLRNLAAQQPMHATEAT